MILPLAHTSSSISFFVLPCVLLLYCFLFLLASPSVFTFSIFSAAFSFLPPVPFSFPYGYQSLFRCCVLLHSSFLFPYQLASYIVCSVCLAFSWTKPIPSSPLSFFFLLFQSLLLPFSIYPLCFDAPFVDSIIYLLACSRVIIYPSFLLSAFLSRIHPRLFYLFALPLSPCDSLLISHPCLGSSSHLISYPCLSSQLRFYYCSLSLSLAYCLFSFSFPMFFSVASVLSLMFVLTFTYHFLVLLDAYLILLLSLHLNSFPLTLFVSPSLFFLLSR